MTTPRSDQLSASDQAKQHTCCGGKGNQAGEWVPKEGEPQVAACNLCELSGRYWRNDTVAARSQPE